MRAHRCTCGAAEHRRVAVHRNRRRRAAGLAFRALRQLRVLGTGREGDPLMEAGLWHVLGVGCGNLPRMLRRSLRTIKKAIAAGTMRAAPLRRMEAESLLRLRDYRAAFEAFTKVARFASEEDLHVAPFRLRHDVLLLERLVAAGRISAAVGHPAAQQLHQALTSLGEECMQGQLWVARVTDLPIEVQESLRSALYDRLECVCPTPRQELLWEDKDPLNSEIDWDALEEDFLDNGLIVVDEFFCAEALQELWRYSMEGTCFRSLRPGYLGAFPWDGCVHPLLRCAAERLEERLPRILHRRPLARWWLFKYLDPGSSGIGVHADEAAVNFNIWLTPTSACRRGGGMEIYRSVPGQGTWTADFNSVRSDAGQEEVCRAAMKSGGVDYVAYRQNRACVFVSDRFHASEPFEFPDVENPRVNLTLLFGDRHEVQRTRRSSSSFFVRRSGASASPGAQASDLRIS
ncbi:hypothetical protein AK812_SmicGene35315 [Symbiodinium microadriaticum]|uniref:Uncharacterized protein n=1 Tax=Symbiodinium microadriaticum TaxID=2951 RepID=A0A1Q9CLT4_SYMMI|nr:hypothetical protein AK812_SmicGene35315 [Symbiodinium microadriaticum]